MFYTANDLTKITGDAADTLHAVDTRREGKALYVQLYKSGDSAGSAWLDKADAERLRDELIETFPLAPAHGFRVGDEVQLFTGERYRGDDPAVLDAPIRYSIGHVTAVDDDRVTVTDSGTNAPGFRFRGEHALSAESVRSHSDGTEDLGYLPHAELLAAEPFKVGDRVRVTATRYAGKTRQPGAVGHIAAVRKGSLAVTIDAERTGECWSFLPGEIELAPLDEPGDPVGSIVYVTGDSNGHGLAAGTEVEIDGGHWYLRDGEYGAHTADFAFDGHIPAADLDVEPPFAPVPVGSIVRITAADAENHGFPVGSLVEVRRAATRRDGEAGLYGVVKEGFLCWQDVAADGFEVVNP